MGFEINLLSELEKNATTNVAQLELDLIKHGAFEIAKNQLVIGNAIMKYHFVNDNTLEIDIIAVPPQDRAKGYARNLMEFVTHYADQNKTDIVLVCAKIIKREGSLGVDLDYAGSTAIQGKNQMKIKDLPRFYAKFGFKENGKENKRVKMIRKYK